MQNIGNPKYQGEKTLDDIDASLVKYSKHIVDLVLNNSKFSSFGDLEILDFGAGRGTLAALMHNSISRRPSCAELDPHLSLALQRQGFKIVSFPSKSNFEFYDLIYTSNVLEHIQDDQKTIESLYESLKPGGALAVYVPAFPVLFSNLDRNVGHYRRYTKQLLQSKLKGVGFEIETIRFVDSVGFFATFLLKLSNYSFSPGEESSRLMKVYDRGIFPLSRTLDSLGCRKIVGKNLFVLARKPKDSG
jgi:SAM-dependent methyltransferase